MTFLFHSQALALRLNHASLRVGKKAWLISKRCKPENDVQYLEDTFDFKAFFISLRRA